MALTERFVAPHEVDETMRFFRHYWGEAHILGNDRDFLLWQMSPRRSPIFADAGLAAVTYWDDGRLVGLIGVQSMPFNCDGEVADAAWLCNLLAAPDYLSQGVGTRLMTSVHRLPITAIGAAGINLGVIPMYRAMRYHCIHALPRFIRIVDADAAAALLEGDDGRGLLTRAPPSGRCAGSIATTTLTSSPPDWDAFWNDHTRLGYFGTHRDSTFLGWRYFSHPRLDYAMTIARDPSGRLRGAAIHRMESVRDGDQRLLRVVEVIAHDPDTWDALLAAVERIGLDAGVAFVDHYTSRPDGAVLRSRGWYEEGDVPGVVTPALFQPLLRQTRRINLAVRLLGATPWKERDWRDTLHVVKSDGDQDRPS